MVFEAGRQLGEYTVTEVLNEGGWAVVYGGRSADGREVALKVLKPELIERPESSHRFMREAQVIAAVKHRHIVEVYDFVEDWEQWPILIYMVMERLSGEDVASVLETSGPLPVRSAVLVAQQVASALGALHAESLLHRDIKPDNIFLVHHEDGAIEAKLLDFGLAKGLGELHGTRLTRAGATIGTMEYMSPEQATGLDADRRADIYGVGATLFTMLTGELPFGFAPDSEDLEQFLTRVAERPVPPVSRYRPNIPPSLAAVVARCMEKDPNARYQTMDELCQVLGQCLAEPQGGGEVPEVRSWANLRVGEKVGNLMIMERLTRGDTTTIYSASHQGLNQAVALKFLNPELTGNAQSVARFARQALAVGKVRHANVVQVLELVREDDGNPPLHVMVMELLIGETLNSLIHRERLLDPPQVVEIGAQIARGLSAIHEAGILHRDIKSENVFLAEAPGKQRQVKLTGFGLVKTFGNNQVEITAQGMAVGTPEFMAPEQILGRELDQRTDVYGLGATLYEMLTGEPPFGVMKHFDEMLVKQTQDPPPSMNEHRQLRRRSAVPQGMEAVVLRCLAKRPRDRFQSAAEVAHALENPVMSRAPVAVPARRAQATQGGGKGWLALIIGALLVAGATVAYLILGW